MEIRAHWPCSSLAGFICADVLCLVFRPECPCIRACLEEKGPNVLLLAPGPRYPRLTHPEWEGTGPTQRYFGDTYLPVTFGFPSGSSEPRRIYFTARPVIRHCTTHVFPTFVPWRINNHLRRLRMRLLAPSVVRSTGFLSSASNSFSDTPVPQVSFPMR